MADWLPANPLSGQTAEETVGRFLVVIARYGVKIMVQKKVSILPARRASSAHLFRRTEGKRSYSVSTGVGIQRIQQPEKGYIGDGKIGDLSLLSRRIVIRRWRRA
jgi:hypothetical protein